MEKQKASGNGSSVNRAGEAMFGRGPLIKNIENGIGLPYGSKKVIPFDSFNASPVIADPSFTESRITGWVNYPKRLLITAFTNIFFSMEPISIKGAASSFLWMFPRKK